MKTNTEILETELNQTKLILEGRNTQYILLKDCLKAIKEEIKNAFEDLENRDLDDLYGTLLQISNLTNNVYLGDN